MATPTPLKLNYNAASLGMSNSKMIGNTNRTYNDMNQSIFNNYNYNKHSCADTSADTSSMDKAIKTQNTIATVGAATSVGLALASIVSMFKKPANTVPAGTSVEPKEDNQTTKGLDKALSNAKKSHDYKPLETEVKKAWADLATEKTNLEQATSREKTANDGITAAKGEIGTIERNISTAKEDIVKANEGLSDAKGKVSDAKTALGNAKTPEEKEAAQKNLETAIGEQKKAQSLVDNREAEKVTLEKDLKDANKTLDEKQQALKDAVASKSQIEKKIAEINGKIEKANAVLAKRDLDVEATEAEEVKKEDETVAPKAETTTADTCAVEPLTTATCAVESTAEETTLQNLRNLHQQQYKAGETPAAKTSPSETTLLNLRKAHQQQYNSVN